MSEHMASKMDDVISAGLSEKEQLLEAFDKAQARIAELEKRLETFERADAIEAQSFEERCSEATHYTWLDDQNEKLESDFNRMQGIARLQSTANEVLEEENQALRSALEFYADASQWVSRKQHSSDATVIYNDRENIPSGPVLLPTGGKLAREVLTKYPARGEK